MIWVLAFLILYAQASFLMWFILYGNDRMVERTNWAQLVVVALWPAWAFLGIWIVIEQKINK